MTRTFQEVGITTIDKQLRLAWKRYTFGNYVQRELTHTKSKFSLTTETKEELRNIETSQFPYIVENLIAS